MGRVLAATLIATCLGVAVQAGTAAAWTPDVGFGNRGAVRSGQNANDMTVDRKGRVIIVGSSGGKYSRLFGTRFNPDGTVNRRFGIDGGNYDLSGRAVDIDSKNRILVAGSGSDYRGFRLGPALFRFNPDGTRDRKFKRKTAFPFFAGYGYSDVEALPGGGILVVGSRESKGRPAILVRKLRDSGRKDSGFGRKGSVWIKGPKGSYGTTGATNLKVLGNGDFLVSGLYDDRPWIGRFYADGRIDRSFGRRGFATAAISADSGCVIFESCAAYGLAVTKHHEIRLLANRETHRGETAYVVGFRRNGSRDRNFGRQGKVKVLPGRLPYGGISLVRLPDSSVAVLGGNRKRGIAAGVSKNGRHVSVFQRLGRKGSAVTAGRITRAGSLFLASSGDDELIRKLTP